MPPEMNQETEPDQGFQSEPDTETEPETRLPEEMTVCYVTEEGEVEQLPTKLDGDGLRFEAEHFSIYAVMATSTGQVDPLQNLIDTFNNAKANDTIKLTEDITIADNNTNLPLQVDGKDITLDLNGHCITITGNQTLFNVKSGRLDITDSSTANIK